MPSPETIQDAERSVAGCLSDLVRRMQASNGTWAWLLHGFVDRDHQLRMAGASVSEWYEFARSVEQLFGGMGTLNDIDLDRKSESLKTELFESVQLLLRRCWKELGRENHDDEIFALLPVGAEISLVPGKVMYYQRDESRRVVPDQRWVHEQSWTIEDQGGPDITNMPTYCLRQGSKHMTVRCESVTPVTA